MWRCGEGRRTCLATFFLGENLLNFSMAPVFLFFARIEKLVFFCSELQIMYCNWCKMINIIYCNLYHEQFSSPNFTSGLFIRSELQIMYCNWCKMVNITYFNLYPMSNLANLILYLDFLFGLNYYLHAPIGLK